MFLVSKILILFGSQITLPITALLFNVMRLYTIEHVFSCKNILTQCSNKKIHLFSL